MSRSIEFHSNLTDLRRCCSWSPAPSRLSDSGHPLHHSLNQNRFKDKIMQPFKVLQRPSRVSKRRAAL
ncbi:hypothetical protein ELH40_00280 [Rhizobium ruizarguesonis]|uniref:Uncharacterized protein n=1 Tax=Rhizobium ruizarguesonis TaxID=2081791 RepID=A0AB38HYP4_9HYPH|nr:hypothetical protein [Rhizobium leguminosarum bv. viciae]TBC13473.1 hypothetical protein ELH40_00280 [Rhizobium ruizarguesonis]